MDQQGSWEQAWRKASTHPASPSRAVSSVSFFPFDGEGGPSRVDTLTLLH